ncbi:MAG: hypothetical protein G01um101491_248 [Parcubacteria group bacterium Gr01-1014_91]|nr:MAG: hypothetical protein G01um101491_248 [Parcubacteria group bacterium Gr01-1014_91]
MKKIFGVLAVVLFVAAGKAGADGCDDLIRDPEYRGSRNQIAIDAAAMLAQTCAIQYLAAAIAVADYKLAIAVEMEKDVKNPALLRLLKKAILEERRYKDMSDRALEKERVIRGHLGGKGIGIPPKIPKSVFM